MIVFAAFRLPVVQRLVVSAPIKAGLVVITIPVIVMVKSKLIFVRPAIIVFVVFLLVVGRRPHLVIMPEKAVAKFVLAPVCPMVPLVVTVFMEVEIVLLH